MIDLWAYLSDFADIVRSSLEQMINWGRSFFQNVVFSFGAEPENGHVWDGFSQLDHCLALQQTKRCDDTKYFNWEINNILGFK